MKQLLVGCGDGEVKGEGFSTTTTMTTTTTTRTTMSAFDWREVDEDEAARTMKTDVREKAARIVRIEAPYQDSLRVLPVTVLCIKGLPLTPSFPFFDDEKDRNRRKKDGIKRNISNSVKEVGA
uniref:Uncharacterized protein n=1 Tax=Vespula pensylvanica TaxID=30213 RepID=A0A834PCJ2_VESPE|nr:hypothetical protein H0235_003772 [Vespula pensylvanica]